jgi:Zn ribbon nucleic-acid-binding protein
MGDTYQLVRWALEYACPMRYGEKWVDPRVTYEQLLNVKRYSLALERGTVFDDICVLDWKTSDAKVRLPEYGFRISETFGKYGGVTVVERNCQNCPANLDEENRIGLLAGCSNSFYFHPWDKELNKSLKRIIRDNELEMAFESAFLNTNPLWFGLWAESSLSREQCEILLTISANLVPPESEQLRTRHFQAALRVSVEKGIRLHVILDPPGHVDVGWRTVFSHCPRCKASPTLLQTEQTLTSEDIECEVCGYHYSRSSTTSSEREEMSDVLGDSLEEILGAEEYWAFVRKYLDDKGLSLKEIEDAIWESTVFEIGQLVHVHNYKQIAEILNREGKKSRDGTRFTPRRVKSICQEYDIRRLAIS